MEQELTGVMAGRFATALPATEVALRLAVAALCSGVLGLDREFRGKDIGWRTHMLVSVGAAGFSILILEMMRMPLDGNVQMDPTRIVEGIVSGIAFLGAGAIIKDRGSVRGATTGAGVWVVGAIGMAAGFGLFLHAVLLTLFALVIMTLFGWLSERLRSPAGHKRDSA